MEAGGSAASAAIGVARVSRRLARRVASQQMSRADELELLYRDRFAGFQKALATLTGSYESAGEVLQEAFTRALAGLDGFRGEASLATWVWRIAANIAFDQRRQREHADIDDADPLALVDPQLVARGHDPELVAALRTLAPRRRLMVFLHYFADCSYAEIAAICDVREGTVAASLAQARECLRAALESQTAPTS